MVYEYWPIIIGVARDFALYKDQAMKRNAGMECLVDMEAKVPVCERSLLPPMDEFVNEATTMALCGVKPRYSRERSSEWLQVVRGETYRLPGVLINNWFDEGQDIVHLQREKRILSDVRLRMLRAGIVFSGVCLCVCPHKISKTTDQKVM